MRTRSKRYRAEAEKVEAKKAYPIDEAVATVKKIGGAKFDASVELAVRLNIDARKSDQIVRGAVSLPKGVGKTRKVIVFADGAEADQAKEAGASEVGMEMLEKLVKRELAGWI